MKKIEKYIPLLFCIIFMLWLTPKLKEHNHIVIATGIITIGSFIIITEIIYELYIKYKKNGK